MYKALSSGFVDVASLLLWFASSSTHSSDQLTQNKCIYMIKWSAITPSESNYIHTHYVQQNWHFRDASIDIKKGGEAEGGSNWGEKREEKRKA